jgi:hypothetical protein
MLIRFHAATRRADGRALRCYPFASLFGKSTATLGLAPRAGFEPATRRLTADDRPFFTVSVTFSTHEKAVRQRLSCSRCFAATLLSDANVDVDWAQNWAQSSLPRVDRARLELDEYIEVSAELRHWR